MSKTTERPPGRIIQYISRCQAASRHSWLLGSKYPKLFSIMITQDRATETTHGLSLAQRRAFMKLPPEERHKQLAELAAQAAKYYQMQEETMERQEWQGGDVVEA